MRTRHNGFTSFMKKLDGETNDDYFSETAGFGGRLHQGYECSLELLRGDICWGTYFQRLGSFSLAERHDMYFLRREVLGITIPSCSMGVYVTDRSFYRQAVEYLRQHQTSEQQDEFPAVADGPVSNSSSDYYIVNDNAQRMWNSIRQLSGATSDSSRSGP